MATSKTKTAKKKATNAKKTSATRKTKTKTKARTSRARSAPAPVTELLPFVEEDEVLGQIVQMLDADDQDHRRSAAVVLGALAIEDAGCLAALRRASCHPDDAILRSRAAEAIGALAPPTIVQDLMPLLKDPESSVRSTARQVLASGRGVTAEDVATMMTARDDRQRIGAIAVLGAMATEDAQVTILEQLDDDSPKILDAILDALQPIYEQMDEEEAGEAADDLIARIDELDLENPRRSRVMTELWAALGHEDAAEGLCRVAATPTDDSVRVQALETLRTVVRGRRQAAAVFAALLDLLEDGETPPALLRPLCDALAGIDLPMNVERRVRALLKSEATPVRRWAIRALGGLDSAPAARAVAELARTGDATDREISLEVVVHTSAGRNALARQLTKMTDGGRAEAAAAALKPHLSALPKSVVDALGEAAVEAPEEVGNVIIGLLSRGGIGNGRAHSNLFDRAMEMKEEGEYADAVALLRRISQGAQSTSEVRFQLGLCELMTSRRKISRGPNRDPCLTTFHNLSRVRDFRLVDRLVEDDLIGDEELYYLGFSLAEAGEDTQGLGGDLLLQAAESSDERINRMAKNKLMTMGWLD